MVSDPFQCVPVLSKKTKTYNNSKNNSVDNDDDDDYDDDGGGGGGDDDDDRLPKFHSPLFK